MDSKLIAAIQADGIKPGIPDVKVGYEVEVTLRVVDGDKERLQKFKGVVIDVSGKTQLDRCITVRKEIDGIAVEKIFPIHSSGVVSILVLRHFKVRRAKLSFLRALSGNAAKLKERKTAKK